MLLKTILNRIERYKSFVYGKVRMLEEEGVLAIEVEVEARANGRPICSGCGRPAPGYDRQAKRLERDGYEPVLKHSRWCLLKRKENLTEKQAVKLSELLQYNLQSVRSRLMGGDFQRFWEYCYPACAAKFLDEWCTRTMRSKIGAIKKVAKTLRRHRALILNWFRAEGTVSAGIVEGLNNKAKLTIRKA